MMVKTEHLNTVAEKCVTFFPYQNCGIKYNDSDELDMLQTDFDYGY